MTVSSKPRACAVIRSRHGYSIHNQHRGDHAGSAEKPRVVHRRAGPPARGESGQRLVPQRTDRRQQAFRRVAAVAGRPGLLRQTKLASGSLRPTDEPRVRGARRRRRWFGRRGITPARIHAAAHRRQEPWGQTVARLQSREGSIIGISFAPSLHDGPDRDASRFAAVGEFPVKRSGWTH
jgi:hypothetical protein